MTMTKINYYKLFPQHPRIIHINLSGGIRVHPRSFEWTRLIPILWLMEDADVHPMMYLSMEDYKKMLSYPVYFLQ